jgi:hypothetical protein
MLLALSYLRSWALIELIVDGPTAMVLLVSTLAPVFVIAGIFLMADDLHPPSQPFDTSG